MFGVVVNMVTMKVFKFWSQVVANIYIYLDNKLIIHVKGHTAYLIYS